MVGLTVSRTVAPTIRPSGPSFAIPPSTSSVGDLQARDLAQPVEELPHRVVDAQREPVRPQPRDGRRDLGDGVVVVQERPVPRHPARPQPHPAQALLRRLDQVEPLLVDREREPADLPDRLGAPREEVRPVLHQPLRAERPTRLLVGDEREDEVARRHHAVAPERAGRPRSSSRPCPSCRPHRGPTRSRPAPRRRTGAPTTPKVRRARRRGARARAAPHARGPRLRVGRRRWPGRARRSRAPPPRTRPR